MARVNYEEAKELASKGGNFEFGFLSLKDKESKTVRFLHENIESIQSFTVHSVQVNNGGQVRTKNVDCLRATNEPVQKCPLCAIGNRPRARIYLALLDEKTHQVIVWERAASFLTEMEGYFQRYGDLRDYVFDIERKGNGLDTKYNLYPLGSSPIEDKSVLPSIPDVYGKLVLTKTAEEQNYFIQTQTFPERINPDANQNSQMPQFTRREPVNTQPQFQPNQQPQHLNPQNSPWGNDAANSNQFNQAAQGNQQFGQANQNPQQPQFTGRRGWN